MKARYLLGATAALLAAGAAQAQYVPATYQEPYCREFTKAITVGGQAQQAYGQACRQPDGSWQIVSDDIPDNQPVQYVPAGNYVEYQPYPAYPTYPASYPYTPYDSYEPAGFFSISFNSWDRDRHRHGWGGRNWDRGDHRGWDHHRRGRDHGNWNGRRDGRGRGRH